MVRLRRARRELGQGLRHALHHRRRRHAFARYVSQGQPDGAAATLAITVSGPRSSLVNSRRTNGEST